MSSDTQSPFRSKHASPWRVSRYPPQPNDSRPERVQWLELPFSLRENGVPRNPTRDEIKAMLNIFPTLRMVMTKHPFLVLIFRELPPEPWPVTLAGLPLWITTDENGLPSGLGAFPDLRNKFTTNGTLEAHITPPESTIIEILEVLNQKCPGCKINSIEWDGVLLKAFGPKEPESGWRARLPSRINKFLITYLWTPALVSEKALRMKKPSPHYTDDTRFGPDQLRPGILVSGVMNSQNGDLPSTSGVCIASPTGTKYITLAAHGFSAGVGDYVYHPNTAIGFEHSRADDRYKIAEVEAVFPDTDIALGRLLPGLQYQAETFFAAETDRKPFRKLYDHAAGGGRIGDFVYMNTPVNGECVGTHIKTLWTMALEADDDQTQEQEKHTHITFFSYWGNGSDCFLDGSCGGVIWNDDMDVMSPFRFQQEDGEKLALGPTFQPLIRQGYTLSSIPGLIAS